MLAPVAASIRSGMSSYGDCPSDSRMTCFLRARAGSSSSTASRRPDRMLVPPPAAMRPMSRGMRCRLAARLQRHDRRGLVVEDDDGDLVGRRHRVGGRARGLLGQLQLGAGHRARSVDDQGQRQRRFLVDLGHVQPHGQHRLEAAVGVAAGAEALRPPATSRPPPARTKASSAASISSGSAARGTSASTTRSALASARGGEPRAARTSAAMCWAASARANAPARRARPRRTARGGPPGWRAPARRRRWRGGGHRRRSRAPARRPFPAAARARET